MAFRRRCALCREPFGEKQKPCEVLAWTRAWPAERENLWVHESCLVDVIDVLRELSNEELKELLDADR